MPVKIHFKVGNLRNARGLDLEEGLEQFAESLGTELIDRAAENSTVDTRILQTMLSQRVTRSIEEAMNFASKTMVGSKSFVGGSGDRGPPSKIYFNWDERDLPAINPNAYTREGMGRSGMITWQALHWRTIKRKRNVGRFGKKSTDEARRFFIHTGELKAELLTLAKNITNKTGTVSIQYRKNAKRFNPYRGQNRRLIVGQLQITFLPGVGVKQLPGVRSGDVSDYDPRMLFERSLRLSSGALAKLAGKSSVHRPMLQPIFTYWMLNRIPRLVAGTIQRSIKRSSQ